MKTTLQLALILTCLCYIAKAQSITGDSPVCPGVPEVYKLTGAVSPDPGIQLRYQWQLNGEPEGNITTSDSASFTFSTASPRTVTCKLYWFVNNYQIPCTLFTYTKVVTVTQPPTVFADNPLSGCTDPGHAQPGQRILFSSYPTPSNVTFQWTTLASDWTIESPNSQNTYVTLGTQAGYYSMIITVTNCGGTSSYSSAVHIHGSGGGAQQGANLDLPSDLDDSGESTQNSKDIRISPNPSKGFINIKTVTEDEHDSNGSHLNWHLLNLSGQQVANGELDKSQEGIQLPSTIQPGVYILKAEIGNKVFTKRVVIE